MSELRIAYLGDVVGSAGRRAVGSAWPRLREAGCHALIVNGENMRNGSGCSPDNYRELKRSGASVVTLGDHVYKDRSITHTLEDPLEPIVRPANLSLDAPGKRIARLQLPAGSPACPPIYSLVVLGRLYMPLLSNSPFEAVDRELAAIPEKDALVFVEIHAEATSEKQALAWHCLERWTCPTGPKVVAVVGSHTHVQTADARLLDHQLAALTDLGMCGPHRSVIGRDVRATLNSMIRQGPSALDVADGDLRATGCIVRIDPAGRRSSGIELVNLAVSD